jgi:DNA-nicking Smr family endonuclease
MARRRDPGPGPDDMDADLLEGPEDADADATDATDAADATDAKLTDELDLHTFLPKECADVVTEYLRAAQGAGMAHVRIVHGKGTGALRRIVHGVLERHPAVRAFRLADERGGSWGATLVELHPRDA